MILILVKGLLVLLSVILTVIALVRLSNKKEHFQIFPDDLKKQYFKEARNLTIINILAVVLIFISFFLLNSSLFYILIFASMFLSMNSIIGIEEDFGDLQDKKNKNK